MNISFIVPAKELDIYLLGHIKNLSQYSESFEVIIVVDKLQPLNLKRKILSSIKGKNIKIYKNKKKRKISRFTYGILKIKRKDYKMIYLNGPMKK